MGAGVTGARAAIAATGTLLLPCGPGRPAGTHIIPPAHVCIVRADDLVATIEDAIALQSSERHPSNMSWVERSESHRRPRDAPDDRRPRTEVRRRRGRERA